MPSRLMSLPVLGGVVLAALASACNVTPAGATDASLAQAKNQAATGASLFAGRCASCHGERGEGKAYAPATMGNGALPVYPRDNSSSPTTTDPVQLQMQAQSRPPGAPSRATFKTAQDLFDFLSKHKPDQSLQTLTPPDVWALVTFVLIAHGSQVPAGGVTPENAGHISI
jgi:mono/diheme cytochrome c family protein